MLNLADLLNLIRLTEIEIASLQNDIEGTDESARDDAGLVIVQLDELSEKLKKMYLESRTQNSEYPAYDDYIELINKNNRL